MDEISIKGIWLRRSGDHVVVDVWMPDGSYREVVREHVDGNFSHCVHAGGIAGAGPCELSDADLEQIAAGKSPQRRPLRPLRYGLRGSSGQRLVSAMGTPAAPASGGCANGQCGA